MARSSLSSRANLKNKNPHREGGVLLLQSKHIAKLSKMRKYNFYTGL